MLLQINVSLIICIESWNFFCFLRHLFISFSLSHSPYDFIMESLLSYVLHCRLSRRHELRLNSAVKSINKWACVYLRLFKHIWHLARRHFKSSGQELWQANAISLASAKMSSLTSPHQPSPAHLPHAPHCARLPPCANDILAYFRNVALGKQLPVNVAHASASVSTSVSASTSACGIFASRCGLWLCAAWRIGQACKRWAWDGTGTGTETKERRVSVSWLPCSVCLQY